GPTRRGTPKFGRELSPGEKRNIADATPHPDGATELNPGDWGRNHDRDQGERVIGLAEGNVFTEPVERGTLTRGNGHARRRYRPAVTCVGRDRSPVLAERRFSVNSQVHPSSWL